jgi:maleate cis-trans isomerase
VTEKDMGLPDNESVVAPWFRLGYIVPHLYVDLDAYQFYKVAPEGMMLVTTSLNLQGYGKEQVQTEASKIDGAVDVLTHAMVDAISLSGVPVGAALGPEATRALVGRMQSRSGLPSSTDIEAHIKALHCLNADRIALVTRWPDEVVNGVRDYLDESGIAVVSTASEPRTMDQNKRADPRLDHELAISLARRALERSPNAEALMMPGGLWFAVHAALQIEGEFGVPVLLNITSTVWEALSERTSADAYVSRPGWGVLLSTLG